MSRQVVVGYPARVAMTNGGLAQHAAAMMLYRLCGSGGLGIAAAFERM